MKRLVVAAVLTWTGAARAFDPSPNDHAYVIRSYQTGDGLPVGAVVAMVQTRDGYLWLGTEDGVSRFDGVRFTLFNRKNAPTLETINVHALYEAPDGTLYLGTYGGGLVRMRDGAFATVAGADTLGGSGRIQRLGGDASGAVYAQTDEGTISRYRDGKSTIVVPKDEHAHSMAIEPDGTVWFGGDKGLGRVDPAGARTSMTTRDGLSSDQLVVVHRDRGGVVWAATRAGRLERIENGRATSFPLGGADQAIVTGMAEDADGAMWLSTREGGVLRFQHGAFTTLTTRDGLPVGKVYNVYIDRESNVWAGTLKGLVRMKRGAFTTFDEVQPGQPGTFVWGVMEDTRRRLWVTTQELGVEIHTPGSGAPPIRFTRKEGLSSDEVSVIVEGHDGSVWVGSQRGLNRIQEGKIRILTTRDGLPSDNVYALLVARNGDIWVGTYGLGLARIRGDAVRAFGVADGLPVEHVTTLYEDRAGRIWAGGEEGLATFANDAFTRVPTPPGDFVFAVHEDDAGAIWIGLANSGLGRLKEGKLTTISSREGLFSDTVYAILDDGRGNFWMSANSGVFRVARAELDAFADGRARSVTSTAYGKEDGMRSAECSGGQAPASWRARDGRLLFPTNEGVAAVDPARLPRNRVVPPVLLEDVLIDRAATSLHDGSRIAAGAREFEFHYTAPSFVAPERVAFKYKLEGFDRDWVPAGTRRVAYYTNLAPGDYTFRVIAANDDGVWNDAGARAAFYVTPHIYETRTFYASVVIALLLGGMGLSRLRVRHLHARAAALEARVRERTHELSTAYATLADKDARLHDDLAQARAFQSKILPALPAYRGARFAVAYRPAELVGGDIYDICELAPGTFRVFLADTEGHGVQASLRTMVLKTEYDRLKRTEESPAALLAALNRAIVSKFPALELRCSACCFDVDTSARTLRYANAAHPPLLLVPGSGDETREIYERSTFLGILDDVELDESTHPLGIGDAIVTYTDGITEQESADGTAFGDPRLRAAMRGRARDLDTAIAELMTDLDGHAGARGLTDDATMIGLALDADAIETEGDSPGPASADEPPAKR